MLWKPACIANPGLEAHGDLYLQLSKAGQPARVQRHSAAVSEADSAVAAATLQARLAPSAAQLAHPDQSSNIDPNPWGPPAHAVGDCAAPGRQAMAMRTSNVQPWSESYEAYSTGAMGSAAAHEGQQQQQQQQQHKRPSALPSRTQLKAGSMLEATPAWFMNPAFGSESPLPSPEKQPRSQPPPQPYPSTCTPAHTSGHPPAGQHAANLAGAAAAGDRNQGTSIQQTAAGSAGYTDVLHGDQMPSYSPGTQWMAAPPKARQHQQPWENAPQATVQNPEELPQWPDSAEASQQLCAHASNVVARCPSHSLHHQHGFPSLPLRQHHQQDPQRESDLEQHGYPDLAGQQPPQHAQQSRFISPSAATHARSSGQHHMHQHQQQQQQQQQQGVVAQDAWQGQQHQPPQEARTVCSDDRMSEYVGQLHKRLAEAEEQAARAQLEGDRRVQTLEARITVLEGRVRFVEGEAQLSCLPIMCALLCSGRQLSYCIIVLAEWSASHGYSDVA